MKNKEVLQEQKLGTRIQLVILWITMMALYIYADIFSLYRPGYLGKIEGGFIGPLQVNQTTLLASGLLMLLPILVILFSLLLKSKVTRWVNILFGILYLIVNIGNVVGETWLYYWMYSIIEIIVTITIIILAFKWPKSKS